MYLFDFLVLICRELFPYRSLSVDKFQFSSISNIYIPGTARPVVVVHVISFFTGEKFHPTWIIHLWAVQVDTKCPKPSLWMLHFESCSLRDWSTKTDFWMQELMYCLVISTLTFFKSWTKVFNLINNEDNYSKSDECLYNTWKSSQKHPTSWTC